MKSAVLCPNSIVLLRFNLNKAFSEHHIHLSPCYNILISFTSYKFIIYFWLAIGFFFEASIRLSQKRTVKATRLLLSANKTIGVVCFFLNGEVFPEVGWDFSFLLGAGADWKHHFNLKECFWHLKMRIWVEYHIKPNITWIGDFQYTSWAELFKQEADLLMIWAIYKMLLFR